MKPDRCRRVLLAALVSAALLAGAGRASAHGGRRPCENHLRVIDAAKEEYALEYGGTNGMTLTWDNLAVYVRDITNAVYCPAASSADRVCGKSYAINPLGTNPVCLIVKTWDDKSGPHTLDNASWQPYAKALEARICLLSSVALGGVAGLLVPLCVAFLCLSRQSRVVRGEDVVVALVVAYLVGTVVVSLLWMSGPLYPPRWSIPFTWPMKFL